jgi:uncharacterized protein YfaT (DUF1175 family)
VAVAEPELADREVSDEVRNFALWIACRATKLGPYGRGDQGSVAGMVGLADQYLRASYGADHKLVPVLTEEDVRFLGTMPDMGAGPWQKKIQE